jgi:methyl-accepting chemotaxis protein
LTLVVLVEVLLIGLLAYALHQLRSEIDQAYQRGEAAFEMVLATYTLRQSSEYLTRFARHYAVTGDPTYRDIYNRVLDIRRGEALRPKNYEYVYWDLMEPYRSNAHPLLYPESLQNILAGLPFTEEELQLLKEAEQNSDWLAEIEVDAFDAMEKGEQQAAIDALYSVDYLRGKHQIMKPIDQMMAELSGRIEQGRQESLSDLERQTRWVLWLTVLILIGNLILYLRRPRRLREPAQQE